MSANDLKQQSIFDRARQPAAIQGRNCCGLQNVNGYERVASAAAGCFLVAYGLDRRSLPGGLAIAAGAGLLWRGLVGHCAVYQALGINSASSDHHGALGPKEGIRLEASIEVDRQPMEVYRFWRTLSNLPQVFRHIESIHEFNRSHSHWIVSSATGQTMEWDAELIADVPGELISWRTLGEADIRSAGSVRFEKSETGTKIHVLMRYAVPGGRFGQFIAQLLGESPEQQFNDDLDRLRDLLSNEREFADLNVAALAPFVHAS